MPCRRGRDKTSPRVANEKIPPSDPASGGHHLHSGKAFWGRDFKRKCRPRLCVSEPLLAFRGSLRGGLERNPLRDPLVGAVARLWPAAALAGCRGLLGNRTFLLAWPAGLGWRRRGANDVSHANPPAQKDDLRLQCPRRPLVWTFGARDIHGSDAGME